LALVLAPLPLLWIARTREVQSATPRFNIISDMDFQARYGPQAASPLFDDGRATRLPVRGAIADGQWEDDEHYFTGRIHGQFAATFPRPVTARMVQRGQERYGIFCATCHGLSGDRDGMTSRRAQKRADPAWVLPPVLFDPPVRDQPVGQIFHTITHGVRKEQDVQQGAPASMAPYASQIPVEDRWAIVLYLRALQRSQNASLQDVPREYHNRLE
jgi:mono/diheme cytochrome c family protein